MSEPATPEKDYFLLPHVVGVPDVRAMRDLRQVLSTVPRRKT